MNKLYLNKQYFEWMCDLIYKDQYMGHMSYNKLLHHLNKTPFIFSLPMDENRALDGIELRVRFSKNNGEWTDDECSILEMMLALALRCEEHIMFDEDIGNRTGYWFFGMIDNLGLMSMNDKDFDISYVDEVIFKFLNRDYDPDGTGGLFTVNDRNVDLRKVDIWYQMCWYLDTLI